MYATRRNWNDLILNLVNVYGLDITLVMEPEREKTCLVTVSEWIKGKTSPSDMNARRIWLLRDLVSIIGYRSNGTSMSQAWLHGSNPWLGEYPPFKLIQDAKNPHDLLSVRLAAELFASYGEIITLKKRVEELEDRDVRNNQGRSASQGDSRV